jgi:hypothetical protein
MDFENTNRTVNLMTGEYTEKIKRYSYWNEGKGYLFGANKKYVRSFSDLPLPKCLTLLEKARINELKYYMFKDSNILAKRTNAGIRALNINDIAEIFGIKSRQTITLLNKMRRNSVIASVEIKVGDTREVQYWFNPLYFHSGKYINLNLYFVFKESLKKHMPQYIIDRFEACEQPDIKKNELGKEG